MQKQLAIVNFALGADRDVPLPSTIFPERRRSQHIETQNRAKSSSTFGAITLSLINQ